VQCRLFRLLISSKQVTDYNPAFAILPASLNGACSALLVGPVFTREAVTLPRRSRFFISRTVYVSAIFVLMCTAWLVLAGTQVIRNIGDMARFGSILFQILAPLQLALIMFLAAIQAASAVAVEKDKKTIILLMMTRLTNSELVLGKLFASLINAGTMLIAAIPIFMFICLFGGTSFQQVSWVFAVTAVSGFAAASLGSTVALWREKTFQALAIIFMAMLFWIGAWEAIAILPGGIGGWAWSDIASAFSPFRAVIHATNPMVDQFWATRLLPFIFSGLGISLLLNGIAINRVRKWNPGREVYQMPTAEEHAPTSIFGVDHDLKNEVDSPKPNDSSTASRSAAATTQRAEQNRSAHVDARIRSVSQSSRRVWDNPVLWREICTWAYGRKVIIVRVAYLLLALIAAVMIYYATTPEQIALARRASGIQIPPIARPLAPLFLVSLAIINALAVNSITNERDGRALDLLLVTDLSPREFLFGKLGGVLYVCKEMVVIPLLLSIMLYLRGAISLEILLYVLGSLLALDVFVSMLGVHCGTLYSNSRQAILVSLGTVFFLFLGIVTCLIMMVSFSGSFQNQLYPFLAFMVGGAVGLFVALGNRNPSSALLLASMALPIAMFFAITSMLLGRSLSVFLAITVTYGFATLAMMIPALGEYNISMGRVKTPGEE
jgi:ABC-type transport system involved in multi-copper enzyme maturation permease subunit